MKLPLLVALHLSENTCSGAVETAIKDLSRWPVSDYYNIWVVSEICNGSFVGYASYPVGGFYDGLVIVSTSMTSNSGTLPHEIGHGFYLYHTFNGDGGNVSCPVDIDCQVNGDYVCDTPPHKQGDCGTINPCTSAGVWDNSRYNFMSYCPLVNRFTQGQKDRMRATAVTTPRASLLTSEGCGIASINSSSELGHFIIFPNPSKSLFTIKLPIESGDLLVADMLGRVILQSKIELGTSTFSLDIPGIYIVNVSTKGGGSSQKIIVTE